LIRGNQEPGTKSQEPRARKEVAVAAAVAVAGGTRYQEARRSKSEEPGSPFFTLGLHLLSKN